MMEQEWDLPYAARCRVARGEHQGKERAGEGLDIDNDTACKPTYTGESTVGEEDKRIALMADDDEEDCK